MKIVPKSDILIGGDHCEAGKAVEVEAKLAESLVTQGFAVKYIEEPDTEVKPKKK
jgi:hypothetical protein